MMERYVQDFGEAHSLIWAVAVVVIFFFSVNPLLPREYAVQVGADVGVTCPAADFTPGGSDGRGGCFPGTTITGIPAGTSLTTYGGSCTITANGTVLNQQIINCTLDIQAANVTITKSRIVGSVRIDSARTGASFTISDSDIQISPDGADAGLGDRDYTATNVKITGGRRSAYCWTDCTITNSYVGNQATDPTGTFHQSGMRMTQNGTFTHNTIWCSAPDVPPDGGCSADQTGYGDFAVTQNNLFEKNLFPATTGGYCSYGGSTAGKPFPNANNIRFIDNIYGTVLNGQPRLNDHGDPDCGFYGAVTAYNPAASGNQFTNNRYNSTTGPLVVPGGP